jgi:phosphopantothenoylcysteine decarboxylase
MNILFGLTGSVASKLAPKFCDALSQHSVKIVGTESAKHFTDVNIITDEWADFHEKNEVLHITLREWADVFVIAPLSANSMAKLANGICDGLLLSVARAWDFKKKFIVAPAMNTAMFNHPVTSVHIQQLKSWGIIVVPPVEKKLFCGDTGIGAMAQINDITKFI